MSGNPDQLQVEHRRRIRLERDDEDHSTSSIALIREKEDTVVLIQSAWVTMAKMAKL